MYHEGSSNALPLVSVVYERHVHPINFEPNYAPSKTLHSSLRDRRVDESTV